MFCLPLSSRIRACNLLQLRVNVWIPSPWSADRIPKMRRIYQPYIDLAHHWSQWNVHISYPLVGHVGLGYGRLIAKPPGLLPVMPCRGLRDETPKCLPANKDLTILMHDIIELCTSRNSGKQPIAVITVCLVESNQGCCNPIFYSTPNPHPWIAYTFNDTIKPHRLLTLAQCMRRL